MSSGSERFVPWAFALLAAGCTVSDGSVTGALTPDSSATAALDVVVQRRDAVALTQGGVGTEVLGLSPAADDEVATVGAVTIRKSQVFDRLADGDPGLAQALIDLCVLDSVVIAASQRFGIDVTEAEIDERVRNEEAVLRLQSDAGDDEAAFVAYVQRRVGLPIEVYRARLRREVARVLWRSYTIRYLAMREERVAVRFLVHDDPAVLTDIAERVRRGADFAALARRWSQDATAAEGGALPPFARGFSHPVARVAFELAPGELSAPVPLAGSSRQALVWCMERMPAREASFAELRAELVAGLETRPVTPFEQNAFVVRYCRGDGGRQGVDSLDSVQPSR